MTAEPEAVTELTAESTGIWLVTTRDSQHIWNLDTMEYTRLPGANAAGQPGDAVPQQIWRIDRYPKVGDQAPVWWDDSHTGMVQWRMCGCIRRIERVAGGRHPLS